MANDDIPKLAMRLVALDRQLAGALRVAIRSWARRQKATPRTFAAMAFAEELAYALEDTRVQQRKKQAGSP